ncbi:MAG: NADH:flavin oxidoreductase [Desulfarculaceae bacterium]|nr:NADH:flavin oxidoreductase [Desulfarculaceae bacterium]MCF8048857.1 NADH:flavin oxidoreductase [Desulfarculaceae bacterium]MCF8065942.1 NADH:flavin oxidoreductase [Desulfarculaceae bacterium]MCF8098743.1 NADH:flavin oxidoreductase [Desulfarculaceae bacterium]MCF8123967.1 NADH:flavin oxidoreductase [Desulfarculaceae bacterium]
MADIFTPWQIKDLSIPNRLVRSATWEGLADEDGAPTHELINALADLAEGGVGLIITGYAYISPEGLGLPKQTGVHIDALVGPLTRISDAVHKSGGLVAMQIVHAGGQTKSKWIGRQAIGPSALVNPSFKEEVAEMSLMQIEDTIDAFAMAAARVKAAGFDAVQLHGAHGYLINQFLSPATNQRTDDYGGTPANRARFAYEVLSATRQAVGPRYPVFIKLGSEDFVEGGLTLEEGVAVAQGLSQRGIDAIEVSGGGLASGKNLSPSRVVKEAGDEGYFLPNAVAIKKVVSCPVICVGGWRSRFEVEKALDQVDAVAMSRSLIRQPDLANRWKAGEEKATCISCNQCFAVGMKQGLGCGQELKKQENEQG